jgi:hypothetical protein
MTAGLSIGGSTGGSIGGSTGGSIGGSTGGSTGGSIGGIGGTTPGTGGSIGGIGGLTPAPGGDSSGTETTTEEVTCLKFLGSYAFAGCTALTEITLPGLPDQVGTNVFDGWTSDQTINLSESADDVSDQIEAGMFEGCGAAVLDKDGDNVDTDN